MSAIPPFNIPELQGPIPLERKGMNLPKTPGLYIITCGSCIAHIGTSKNLQERVYKLATLDTHRGSNEVLCAAHCTGLWPQVWWKNFSSAKEAERREQELKDSYGEPPIPDKYLRCKNGDELRRKLRDAAGHDSWEAGYIEAVFRIGEKMSLIFEERFEKIWGDVGKPPGPWLINKVY